MSTTEQMTSRERVIAALRGEAVDRPPVSLWRHFPNQDQSAGDLAGVTRQWQNTLELDFIKLMPPGDYATIDWGATSEYRGAAGGTRETTRYPVQRAEDWGKIRRVPADAGFNAEVIRACALVREAVGPEIPVLQTIFSPLTIASKMSNGLVVDHLREKPEIVHEALLAIRDVTIEVSKASLRAGASGVFFASQLATADLLTEPEYLDFGTNYDLEVLEETNAAGSAFTLIHIHGSNTFFHLLAGYPGNALNWHDRRIGPDIPSVQRAHPDMASVAGVDERGIAAMSPDEVRDQVREARVSTGDRHLMIAPGCVILVATPEANLKAAVEATKAPRTSL